jgi:hypothetical protein
MSGEYDVCDVTLSVYPHRASLKNISLYIVCVVSLVAVRHEEIFVLSKSRHDYLWNKLFCGKEKLSIFYSTHEQI